MGKEYKITVTCENRDKYISRWIDNQEGHEIIDNLKKQICNVPFLTFVDELGCRTIFPKECLMKSVIQIRERVT